MKKAFPGLKMPADLDREGKRKFREMAAACDPDVDLDLLANYCRQYSSLVSVRKERARQEATGAFELLVPGRDGMEVLNPLEVQETRLIAAQNKMLITLGLATSREDKARRGPAPAPGVDPLELALCGPSPEPSATEIEANRRRQANEKLLARNDWRAFERDFDGGKKHGN